MSYVLGVDIGGTNVAYGLCNKDGDIEKMGSTPVNQYNKPSGLVKYLKQLYVNELERGEIKGIGIGAPNGNHHTGCIEFAPNLLWKGNIPLVELFNDEFNLTTILTNDANAAALGEKQFGAAQDLNHFVSITLGTGVGSGVIVDNELVYGHQGLAGEFGHIRVIPNGRSCGCGRKGCLETYTSSTGVVRSIQELSYANKEISQLFDLTKPTAKDVFECAEKGDEFAKYIVDYTAKVLGGALADFCCFSNPQAFVLFGGIAQSGQAFIDKVADYMNKEILSIYQSKVEVRCSNLHDKNAAVLGASALIWNKN